MGYVIASVLVVLLVCAFATVLVLNATRKSGTADADDPGADPNPLGIVGSDEGSPLGDTREHAGTQDEQGRTVAEQDADRHGGTGVARGYAGTGAAGEGRQADRAEVGRPLVGGEAEGERSLE